MNRKLFLWFIFYGAGGGGICGCTVHSATSLRVLSTVPIAPPGISGIGARKLNGVRLSFFSYRVF